MVILYLVAPIMAPFNISLETLKIFLTSWVRYRTSVNLTVYPPWRLKIYCDLKITLNFPPIYNCHIYLEFFNSFMFFSVYVMCNDELLPHGHSLGYSSLSLFDTSPHNMGPKISFQHNLIYFSSCTNNQPPCGHFSAVVTFSVESRFSVIIIFAYFIIISPEIWRSVAILAILVSCALE